MEDDGAAAGGGGGGGGDDDDDDDFDVAELQRALAMSQKPFAETPFFMPRPGAFAWLGHEEYAFEWKFSTEIFFLTQVRMFMFLSSLLEDVICALSAAKQNGRTNEPADERTDERTNE